MNLRTLVSAALLAAITPLPALALSLDETVGIEARGRVDLDAFRPQPELSSDIQAEIAEPFNRSVVSVGDAQTGLFSYFASADIGNLAMKVSGSLSNATNADYFGFGVPIVQAVAEARDIVVLSTGRTDPFDVTLELVVKGELSSTDDPNAASISSHSANSLLSLTPRGQLGTSDSGRYLDGVVDDTLSITRQVSGPEVTLEISTLLSYNVILVKPGQTVTGDLSNTAFLRLILPEDVTIASSASGTFGVPIPIPEPGTLALAAAGLVLVAGAARRRLHA